MKRLQKFFRTTLMLAIASSVIAAPVGSLYASTVDKADTMKSPCAQMGAQMKMDDGQSCPHHKNMGDGADSSAQNKLGSDCEKKCNDCKAANPATGMTQCPLHTAQLKTPDSESGGSVRHACPHQSTNQPPKH